MSLFGLGWGSQDNHLTQPAAKLQCSLVGDGAQLFKASLCGPGLAGPFRVSQLLPGGKCVDARARLRTVRSLCLGPGHRQVPRCCNLMQMQHSFGSTGKMGLLLGSPPPPNKRKKRCSCSYFLLVFLENRPKGGTLKKHPRMLLHRCVWLSFRTLDDERHRVHCFLILCKQ